MGTHVLERHFDGDDQHNAILAPLIDCYEPSRTVSGKPNIHSGSFNNVEQFFIHVSDNTFDIKDTITYF